MPLIHLEPLKIDHKHNVRRSFGLGPWNDDRSLPWQAQGAMTSLYLSNGYFPPATPRATTLPIFRPKPSLTRLIWMWRGMPSSHEGI